VDPRRLGRLWHLGHRDDGHRVEPKPDRPVAPHQGQALVATDIDPHLPPADVDPHLRGGTLEDDPVDRAVEEIRIPGTVAGLDDLDVFGPDIRDDLLPDRETWPRGAADRVTERFDQPARIVAIPRCPGRASRSDAPAPSSRSTAVT